MAKGLSKTFIFTFSQFFFAFMIFPSDSNVVVQEKNRNIELANGSENYIWCPLYFFKLKIAVKFRVFLLKENNLSVLKADWRGK